MRTREMDSIAVIYADDDYMDVHTASRYLMWSDTFTYQLIHYDLIPYKKEGRKYLLKKKDLVDFNNKCRQIHEEEEELMWEFLDSRRTVKGRVPHRWSHKRWIEYMIWRKTNG